jgi:hypothetical protein
MKATLFALIISIILVIPVSHSIAASNAKNSSVGEENHVYITELYSDLESFDATFYSDKLCENLTLQVVLLKPEGNDEKIVARQFFSVASLPANTRITKVGFWNIKNAQRGAYSIRASLIENGQTISESKDEFSYATHSVSKLRVGNLIPNSQGISIVISPVEAVLFDIEYMLVDGSDVVYTLKKEKVSLTNVPETFSESWGTLLENNREYQGRVKIRVYSPQEEIFVSTKPFIAKANAEITDVFKDETGASATVTGRSQVPFEGNLVFTINEINNTEASVSEPMESIREKVPVLLNGDDETIEVAWKQRLPKGIYKLEIELLGNSNEVIEHRETIIESDISPRSYVNAENNSTSGTEASNRKKIPAFSAVALISGLVAISLFLRKRS